MKLTKNQSGIAHLAGILIVVLILGLSFAAWRVYTVTKENKKLKDSSSKTETKTESNTPEDFLEYENKDLGFKFAYPKEWGVARLSDTKYSQDPQTKKTINIYGRGISFSQNKEVTLAFNSTKNIPAPKGGVFSPSVLIDWCESDGGIGPIYHTAYEGKSCFVPKLSEDKASFDLYESSTKNASPAAIFFHSHIAEAHGIAEPTKASAAIIRINKNQEYPTVVIEHSGDTAKAIKELSSIYKTLRIL